MKNYKSLFLCLVLSTLLSPLSVKAQPGYVASPDILAARERFQDNKFGIFIHWGFSSMLGQGEWVMNTSRISPEEYSKMASGFYPSKFDAAKWVADIKASGAKYICFVSRHHDGFSLFETKYSDYDIMDATPWKRDIVKELADECHKQGIALHFYYSLLDWYRDDYPKPVSGLPGQPAAAPVNSESYFDFMKNQITELLTNYGPIGCIWFDGHWNHREPGFNWHYDEIYSLIHRLQPSCLVGNNHHIDPIEGEDIQIFERDVPGQNTAGYQIGGVSTQIPLETCQTMNGSWGFKITDNSYKSNAALIKYLVSTAGRNANLLLNVGPQPNGEIPAAAVERLAAMGQWMNKFGTTIYGTRSTLVPPQPWGVTTHKDGVLWLHVFPADLATSRQAPQIYVPYKNAAKIKSVTVFESGQALPFKQYKEGLFVTLPDIPTDVVDFVIEVK